MKDTDGLEIDPKERDPKYRKIIEDVEREARDNLIKELGPEQARREGFCFLLWGEQKRILKEKYGIDWKSPDEMNPDVLFD